MIFQFNMKNYCSGLYNNVAAIEGLFGPLAVYIDPAQSSAYYVGSTDFLDSALFQDRLEFRA